MTDFSNYFPKRCPGDQLDVICLLREGLQKAGDRWAFVCEGSEVSVAELKSRIAQVQAKLISAGLKPGQRVALMLANSVDHVALIYALILVGAVWIPVNVRLRGAGLSYIIEHSKPEFLIFDAEFEDVIAELNNAHAMRLADLMDASGEPDVIFNSDILPSDTLCIIYTSGTTGAPKGVVFTHRMLRIASEAALMVADIGAGDRAFLWEPLCHIGGAQMLMVPFLVDAQLHIVKRFSARRFWSQWVSAKATHLHYLGGILDVLMQLPRSAMPQGASIPVAWGAGVSAQSWRPIQERFGCQLRECYGMTEGSSFATLNLSGTPGSIGAPLPWISLELFDEAGKAVPKGALGEIVLSSDVEGVFLSEYLDNPEATRQALRGGKLFTGDMARQLDNGEYAFVGRRSDSMRVRGENVSAWEIERVFAEHPAIKAIAAVGVSAAVGEQDILLYVQFETATFLEWNDLVTWARPRLASFQLPRYFASVEKFDLTPSERIRKHKLPKTVEDAWDRTGTATIKQGVHS
jgi:crotonobetaine/carnitine-CoA ligase